jgi:DNA-binding MarR family transcriptional regulator
MGRNRGGDTTSTELAGASPRQSGTPDRGFVPIEGINVPGPNRPQSVGFTISTIGYALASAFHELLGPLGLEPKVFALLASVASSEGVTQQAIAERMRVAPSRMVAFVDSLEERGLLERRQNPDDRRARALYLTPAGRKVLGQAFAIADRHERRLTSDLNDEERRQLLDLLSRVGAHVGIPRVVQAEMGHSALADELK